MFEPTVIGAMAELANLRYKTLYGLTLGEDYLFNGNKHLAYISGGHLGVGIDLYIDIDDYYTVMHPEDPITGEGAKQPEHWVTVWVDGKIGLGAGLPGSFGLVHVPRITFEDDPRRKWNVSGPGATLGPIVKVKWFEFTDQGFDWGKTDWFESVGIDFSIASLSGNVARFEIKKDVLDLIIADAFSPVPGVIGGVVLNNFASNLIASLIGVESDNGQLTVGGTGISSIGFDSVRAFTVSDAPGGPATFGGTIDYVWGGLDIDGDGRPDNYYPVVPNILGIPFWGQRLDICFRNIGSEPASYFVRLVGDLPPGWMVVADDGTDLPLLIDKKYDVPDVSPNQPYNDCNNTKWVVAATKDAAEFAKVTFELHQDKFLTNPLQDTVEVTLRKGEEISDPSPDPTPTPTPEPEKDGFDFTSGEDGGSGFFSQSVPQNGRAIVGAIPAGITNLFVELDAENDLDIELWDGDTFVVGWVADGEQAQIFSSTEITGDYNGVTITWSGWDGTNGNRGDEFMQINGTTQNEFVMKVFGFEAGTVAANYSWGSSTKKILGPIAVILPIILILACDSSSPTAAPGTGGLGQTPEVGDTGLDQDRTAGLGVPTATPVPAAAIEATGDFAAGKVGVDQDWERFHEEFDTWRSGLISCDASSVSVRLQQFAGDFAGITEDARNLPRTSAVRSTADRLILAAEGEEEALRGLRDIWILGSVAGLEGAGFDFAQLDNLAAFELVDLARSQASVLQKEVADELSDRLARASSQGDAETFNEDSQQIGLVWDQFHKDYDSFRAQEGTLTSVETVNQLGELVDQFRNVVASVRQLPTFESTRRAAQILADAAQEEETALRNLRDTFQRFDEGAGSESNLEGGGGDGPAESSAEASDAVFIAEDPGLFNTFTSQIVLSNESRRQAQLEMADVLDEVSSRSQTELKDFEENYQLLATRWTPFTEVTQMTEVMTGGERPKADATAPRLLRNWGSFP